jgi:hypothetical protein
MNSDKGQVKVEGMDPRTGKPLPRNIHKVGDVLQGEGTPAEGPGPNAA